MAGPSDNPLISSTRASDTSPTVQLHPLVLLTITDCITRHTLRKQDGPVVGAVLGQQNGHEVTMEVAFQAKLVSNDQGETVLDDEWFMKRLDEYKDVHKQPQLDMVAWFTLAPPTGPTSQILPIHTRVSELTESPILCLFHPSDAGSEATAAGKLPLTLYETVYESASGGPNDKAMDIDGAVQNKALKFRELVYTVETGEAEMIAPAGGGNATAVEGSATSSKPKLAKGEENKEKKAKGKQKDEPKDESIDEATVLTAEDEELLSTLTAKMNAIRMLSRRISLLRTYLASLTPSYLSDPSLPIDPSPTDGHPLPLNHSILRSVSAMLARINILAPPDVGAFILESQQEASDVQLVQLLSSITNSVSAAKDLGKKSQIVENGKSQSRRGVGGSMGSFMGGAYEGGSGGQYFDNILGGPRQFGTERWG
ncbi:hypothetical protein N0V90_006210 [Kalmusia sp. IMI 367209]|nr:hypothetical protein N0V90_006210 [Kalmusia sp. IMI 367209]